MEEIEIKLFAFAEKVPVALLFAVRSLAYLRFPFAADAIERAKRSVRSLAPLTR